MQLVTIVARRIIVWGWEKKMCMWKSAKSSVQIREFGSSGKGSHWIAWYTYLLGTLHTTVTAHTPKQRDGKASIFRVSDPINCTRTLDPILPWKIFYSLPMFNEFWIRMDTRNKYLNLTVSGSETPKNQTLAFFPRDVCSGWIQWAIGRFK